MNVAPRFFGAKIRQARLAAGMTQAALAHAAGTRERNIVRWENNQHAPRLEHVAAIATATGRDVDFFLTDDEAASAEDDDEESDAVADLMAALRLVVRTELAKARA
jgi:transcriptional regulator with XRE-family HTH domain